MEEIKIKHVTKIEGHAKLVVKFSRKNKKVELCSMDVFESPRYFESLIKERNYNEVPYLAGRICGICNVAHLIGSTIAVENALGIEVSEQTKLLRELMVLGGVLHSHVLQLYFLSLPDYLGYSSALDMKGKDLELLKKGLKLKEVGNELVRTIGGRSIHPITSIVGGFTKLPDKDGFEKLEKKLQEAKVDAEKTVELFESLKFPEIKINTDFLALKKNKSYPFLEGDVVSLSGTCFRPEEYKKYLKETVVEYSTSKHVTLNGKSFMVGPLARLNIRRYNKAEKPQFNLFYANLARALEAVYCIDRSLEILENLALRKEGVGRPEKENGEGISATEAPRGLLFHHYKIKNKKVVYVNIIPPTTQNVKNMEEAIIQIIPQIMNLSKKRMTAEIEKLIRAYDPCFSCSAHFLELEFI